MSRIKLLNHAERHKRYILAMGVLESNIIQIRGGQEAQMVQARSRAAPRARFFQTCESPRRYAKHHLPRTTRRMAFR